VRPDITARQRQYTGKNTQLRVGLMQLTGLESGSMYALLEARKKGLFRSFDDFLCRAKGDAAQIKILIKAGAFDRIEPKRTRPELIWQLVFWNAAKRNGKTKVLSLFDTHPGPAPQRAPDYDLETILRQEQEVLGFLISRHPLDLYRDQLRNCSYVLAKDLSAYAGCVVNTLGWFVTGKVVATRTNETMEFMSFEDTSGIYEATFFPKIYAQFAPSMSRARPYILRGRVEEEFGAVSLNVSDVRFL
ncbi:MAG: OB-fold nucleic acid binding domain-containing protein, partial [Candidatus Latescibacterota bacterium]